MDNKREQVLPKTIGTAVFTDFEAFKAWYASLGAEDAESLRQSWKANYNDEAKRQGRKVYDAWASDDDIAAIRSAIDIFFEVRGGYVVTSPSFSNVAFKDTKEGVWQGNKEKNLRVYESIYMLATEMGQSIHVIAWNDDYAAIYIGNAMKCAIVPSPNKYMEFTPNKDYSNVTPNELRGLLNANGYEGESAMIPVDMQGVMTISDMNTTLKDKQTQAEQLRAEIEDVENAATGELAQIKAEIQKLEDELKARKDAMLETLMEKKAMMDAEIKKFKSQIYLLDSQIYAIRCYAGEVTQFAKVRSGKNAPDDEPIVIYQKLRFLDEDLGRLASLYEISWGETNMFELFLQHHPEALEVFAPNERCVTLVRLSRDAKVYAKRDDVPYSNMLDQYDYYHGRTVGIIIRNGENLYLGWTDEERVHIDDDFIMTEIVEDAPPQDSSSRRYETQFDIERKQKERERQQRAYIDGIISRTFVYNILQGIVDNSSLLPLPKGVTLNRESVYVKYAVADKWLRDTRFGDFGEIVNRCNARVSTGDMVLTTQNITAVENNFLSNRAYGLGSWENSRGIGDRNRTHDCTIDDCTIYPVNKVVLDPPYTLVSAKLEVFNCAHADIGRKDYIPPTEENMIHSMDLDTFMGLVKGAESETNEQGETVYAIGEWDTSEGKYKKLAEAFRGYGFVKSVAIVSQWEVVKQHNFLSIEKEESKLWKGTDARANVEIKDGEYINLTYMNSVWLEWVINNRELGKWTASGAKVNFAYAIRYLNKALEFVRIREKNERENIDAVDSNICTANIEWSLAVSEFKLEMGVRELTPYQAKRFAKWYSKQKEGTKNHVG